MPRAKSDTDLIAAIRGGNLAAFSEVVTRYQQVVCAVAFSACGSQALSEDVAQDTFVAAWKNIDKLQDEKKLKGWLCSIARNKAKDALRKRHRETPTKDDDEEFITQESDAPSPFQRAASVEEESQVWCALRELPESYRETLVLFYREEQSVAEVAEGLDLSIDAVKQRLRRGRAALKDSLDKVSHCLARTQPSKAFGVGVIAAIAAQSGVAQAAASQAAPSSAGGLERAATHKGSGAGAGLLQPLLWMALCAGGLGLAWYSFASSEERSARVDVPTNASSDSGSSQHQRAGARPRLEKMQERSGPLAIEGMVLDVFQRPVAGAKVVLRGELDRETTSAEDGSFRFDELPDGSYRIKAQSHDGSSLMQPVQLDEDEEPVVLTIREGSSVELTLTDKESGAAIEGASLTLKSGGIEVPAHSDAAGQHRFAGITEFRNVIEVNAEGYAPVRLPIEVSGLPGRQERSLRLVPGLPLVGSVHDASGRAVANAKVIVEPHLPGPRFAETLSDESGHFHFPAIAAEDAIIVVTHDDYAWTTQPLGAEEVRSEEAVELVMHEGREVSGIARLDDGRPASGAIVVSNPSGKHTTCDEEGRFTLRGLEAEEESLLARHGPRASTALSIAPRAIAPKDHARGGHRLEGLELELRHSRIQGRVIDHEGQPVAGALVRADRRFAELDRFHSRLEQAQDRTDSQGRFTLSGLPADGNYELQAIRPGVSPAFLHQVSTEDAYVSAGSEGVEVMLDEPGLLSGTVHSQLGEVSRFSITLARLSEDLEFSASFPFEDTEREFALGDIPPGRYSLAIVAPGHRPTVIDSLEIGDGDSIELGRVELERGRDLSGVVRDDEGRPVPHARVLIGNMIVADERQLLLLDSQQEDGVDPLAAFATSSVELRTDDAGVFRAENLYADDLPLFIAAEERHSGRSRVTKLGTAREIDLRLERSASLSGELSTRLEGGDRDISVTAIPLGKEAGSRFGALEIGVLARDGHFEMSGLSPGRYLVVAHRSTLAPDLRSAIELTLEPGSHRDLQLEVQTQALPMWDDEALDAYEAGVDRLCRCSNAECRADATQLLDAISDAHSDLTPQGFERIETIDDERAACEDAAR